MDLSRAVEGANDCCKVDAAEAEGIVDESILVVICVVACSLTGVELVRPKPEDTRHTCLNNSKMVPRMAGFSIAEDTLL